MNFVHTYHTLPLNCRGTKTIEYHEFFVIVFIRSFERVWNAGPVVGVRVPGVRVGHGSGPDDGL